MAAPKTILVVEDDKSVARMLQDVLESEGFAVLSERDGEWGLRAFQDKPVDLLIVDVLVPKIKGFDLIARLRETAKGRTLPIVVISGVYRSAMHRERIIGKHQVVEYLDKPVDLDRLIDVLHDVFSSAYPEPKLEAPPIPEPVGPVASLSSSSQPSLSPSSSSRPSLSSSSQPSLSPSSSPPSSSPSLVAPSLVAPSKSSPSASVPSTSSPAVLSPSRSSPGVEPLPLEVPEHGEVEEIPFARLLGALFASRATGVLLLRKASVKKIVYLRQGIPVFVKSNLLNECLGRIMVAERLITQEECDRSLEKKKTVPKKQGEILVEMGSISPHNLEFALELQMQTKLFEVFSWLEGKYQFIPKDDLQGAAVALSLAPTAMIYEGASRTMSSERIERDLERIEHLAIAPSRDPTFRYQALELDPRAGKLIDRIDGKRTVRALLEEVDFDEDDAALLLYALSCTGLLKTVGAPKRVDSKVPAPVMAEPEPMVLDDADVVALSTGEINASAELARLDEVVAAKVPAAALPGSDAPKRRFEADLFDEVDTQDGAERLDEQSFSRPEEAAAASPAGSSSASSVREGVQGSNPPAAAPAGSVHGSSLPAAAPAGSVHGSSSLAAAPAGSAPAASGAAAPSASAASAASPSASAASSGGTAYGASSSAASSEALPRAPVAQKPASDRNAAPLAPAAPAMSDEIRRQIRARLEAETAKLAAERAAQRPITNVGSAPRKVPSRPKEPISRIQAPRLDIERELARTKKELTEVLERLDKQSHYEVLGVHRRASLEDLRAAHQRLAREHHPERAVPSATSRENRALAETIYIRIGRAFETLADPELRRAYDRSLHEAVADDRIAPLLLAERAFARGKAALDKSELDLAYEAFKEAADLNASEGAYWAHLGYTAFSRAPKDDQVRELALAQLDRALELSPRSEEVYVFRGSIHQKAGHRAEAVRDFEAAVRINPDSVTALNALRALEPPAARKTGLLSRLTLGGDRNS